ncbi:hypothetical protein C9374_001171 [Naegleria lovaniensis]|uniref:Uncharacterized protein n=1 Tax=Naegleria lovaniensis TaxID=51637 RepID=A0AA88GRL2_NAELO|nr:uncharacterized protein C9374_001171 [Naegleria lovaniensis]KAG2387577.1 hypothetical protein C9374_001171 [Naegleria lovaniensis]
MAPQLKKTRTPTKSKSAKSSQMPTQPTFSIYETTYESNHHGAQLSENLKQSLHKRAPLSTKITYTADHKEHHLNGTISSCQPVGFNPENETYKLLHPSIKYASETKSSFTTPVLAPNIEENYALNTQKIEEMQQEMKYTMATPSDSSEIKELMGLYSTTTKSNHDKTKPFSTASSQTKAIVFRDAQQRGKVKTGVKSFAHTVDMSVPPPSVLKDDLRIKANVIPQSFAHTSNFGMSPTTKEHFNPIHEKHEESHELKLSSSSRVAMNQTKTEVVGQTNASEQKSKYVAYPKSEYVSHAKTFSTPQVFTYRKDAVNGVPYSKPVKPTLIHE